MQARTGFIRAAVSVARTVISLDRSGVSSCVNIYMAVTHDYRIDTFQ